MEHAATHLTTVTAVGYCRSPLILQDNTFGWGRIADPPSGEGAAGIAALQAFNLAMAGSGRLRATILPTAEGLTLGIKLR